MRLYLDACCWNRPFDDQSQLRVRLEAAAVLAISEGAEQELWTLLSSSVLEFELARTPDPQRRAGTQKLSSTARERISIGPIEIARAEILRTIHGLGEFDALHLACAETLDTDAFLTTDDRLLRACHHMAANEIPFVVANPQVWLTDFVKRG